MKHQTKRWGYALLALVILTGAGQILVTELTKVTYTAVAEASVSERQKSLEHRREVWLHALEWCESSGRYDAINEEDLDGTPSYGAYQFKPATFYKYVERYGIEVVRHQSDLYTFMNYEAQKEIVLRMMDDPKVRWENEFPWCVKKLGRPPVK